MLMAVSIILCNKLLCLTETCILYELDNITMDVEKRLYVCGLGSCASRLFPGAGY